MWDKSKKTTEGRIQDERTFAHFDRQDASDCFTIDGRMRGEKRDAENCNSNKVGSRQIL